MTAFAEVFFSVGSKKRVNIGMSKVETEITPSHPSVLALAFPILGQTYIHFPLPKSLFYTGLIPNIIPIDYI